MLTLSRCQWGMRKVQLADMCLHYLLIFSIIHITTDRTPIGIAVTATYDEVWIRETKDNTVIKREVYCIVQISIIFKRLFYSTRIIYIGSSICVCIYSYAVQSIRNQIVIVINL